MAQLEARPSPEGPSSQRTALPGKSSTPELRPRISSARPSTVGRMGRGLGRLLAVALGLAVLALVFGGRLVSLYVDYLWFESLRYAGPFLTVLGARVALFFLGGALFLLLFLPNVLVARAAGRRIAGGMATRIVPSQTSSATGNPRPFGDLAEYMGGPAAAREVVQRLGARSLLVAGLGLGAVMGLAAAGQWEGVLRARQAVPFGVQDPVFGRDAGFYVF